MRQKLLWVLGSGLMFAAALVISACGSDSGSSSAAGLENRFPPPTTAPDGAQKGGDLTVLAAGDVDYIDPGAAYYQFSYMIDSATQRQVLSWAPEDVENPTPDL